MSDVPVRGYRLVVRVVLLQTGCALLVASVFLVLQRRLARPCGAGGRFDRGCRQRSVRLARVQARDRGRAPRSRTAMYVGVALKWLWFAIALYLAFARLKLEAAPLLIGMVAAQLGYWVGLIRLK